MFLIWSRFTLVCKNRSEGSRYDLESVIQFAFLRAGPKVRTLGQRLSQVNVIRMITQQTSASVLIFEVGNVKFFAAVAIYQKNSSLPF